MRKGSSVSERQFQLSDARRAGITAFGAPPGVRWVMFCHPAPGSGGFDPDPLVTQRCDLSFVSLDRPGYSSSDPWIVPPQPSPQRWVLDVQEFLADSRRVADSIGRVAYRGLGVLGWREGCVFAAALAAALGDETAGVAFVEPMTLRQAAESLAQPDVWDVRRLIPGIQGPPTATGLRSRVERMLGAAAEQGDVGLNADRAAMKQKVLDESLEAVQAPALVLARNTRASRRGAHHYARRLPDARVAVTDAPVPIAAHWARIIKHFDETLH